MSEEIIEYLNSYELTPGAKWVVAVILIGEQHNYTYGDLKDFTQMAPAVLDACLEDLARLRIVESEQGVDDEYYFIIDIRIIKMAAQAA